MSGKSLKGCSCVSSFYSNNEFIDEDLRDNDISDIFRLIDQYYGLYKQVIEKQREICNPSETKINHLHDTDDKEFEYDLLQFPEDMSDSTLEFELESTDLNKDESSRKRVHFGSIETMPEEIEEEEETQIVAATENNIKQNDIEPPSNDLDTAGKTTSVSCEEKIEIMLQQVRYKRNVLDEKFISEISRQTDLRIRSNDLKEKNAAYQKRMEKNYESLSKINDENRQLCQSINEVLQELKKKQQHYDKSPEILNSNIRKLHQKQKQLKENEFHILMVRNLKLRIQITERNSKRIKKQIEYFSERLQNFIYV